jgi:hypothetical protein
MIRLVLVTGAVVCIGLAAVALVLRRALQVRTVERDQAVREAGQWRNAYHHLRGQGMTAEVDTQQLPIWPFLNPQAGLPVEVVADAIDALERHANRNRPGGIS